MAKYTYTEDALRAAVHHSYSIRRVLLKLGIIAAGGNYRTTHKRIKALNIDTSHFTGKGWRKGRTFPDERPCDIECYLANERSIQSHRLRLLLIAKGYKAAKCEMCRRTKWQGNPIPLELDHINGIHADNTLSNLRIVCPNCHATTSTYRGRNKRKSA